jgi:NAD(P)-dependent dehydrogenase (short-subunit alcohol dehydrogenase family)
MSSLEDLVDWAHATLPSPSSTIMLTKAKYEFVRQLSNNPSNIVVGLVRNKAATYERLAKDGIKNATIFEADITDFTALEKAAAEITKLTGGSLDYLINNAALVSETSGAMDMGDLYFLGFYL